MSLSYKNGVEFIALFSPRHDKVRFGLVVGDYSKAVAVMKVHN